MSDVTALVLTMGESYTDRAIASVRGQTLPVAETIVVRGMSPFHRALNSGAASVRTEFFIQVDADMILDDTCIEGLRGCVSDGVGTVVGQLRDRLVGRVVGIKLFRTRCFERVRLRDSISPETEFRDDLLRAGWTTIFALKHAGELAAGFHTFGEHRPDYNPHYTFCKYRLAGAKARHRKAGSGLRSIFRRLHASAEPVSIFAVIGAAHGIFVEEQRDIQGPFGRSEEFDFLEAFLTGAAVAVDVTPPSNLGHADLETRFKRSYDLGLRLRRQPAAFVTCLRGLQRTTDLASWVALVGLCHGLFAEQYTEPEADAAFALLSDLLP